MCIRDRVHNSDPNEITQFSRDYYENPKRIHIRGTPLAQFFSDQSTIYKQLARKPASHAAGATYRYKDIALLGERGQRSSCSVVAELSRRL